MSGKVVPTRRDGTFPHGSENDGTEEAYTRGRASRVFRAVNDVYEFEGWRRFWVSVIWFILMAVSNYYSYPSESGAYNANVVSLMTSYEPSPGASNSDVRDVNTFAGGISHALGFISAYTKQAVADGFPEGVVPVTEYDTLLFARLELDFKTNCGSTIRKFGFNCYKDGLDPATGAQLDPGTLEELAGPDGIRQVILMDGNFTREEITARIAQVLDEQLMFMSTYAYSAVVRMGMANSVKPYYRTVYNYLIGRKDPYSDIAAYAEVLVSIDNMPIRSLPLYTQPEDRIRAVFEVICLLFLLGSIMAEIVQFSVCRTWLELHLPQEEPAQKGTWGRHLHLLWIFFAQAWNIVDAVSLLNYSAYWVTYSVIVFKSYHAEVTVLRTSADFDVMLPYADLRFNHMIWGIFTTTLIGIRILPLFKMHSGLRVYSNTLQRTGQYLKDLAVFFGYVLVLVVVLLMPLFTVTGANARFKNGSQTLLNVGLMMFGNFGYPEYFADNAPTFGTYKTVFMVVYWVVLLILVVISQNVLLALVAAAYDESREAEGNVDRSYLGMSAYRLCWMVYSRWHKWVRRQCPYALVEHLLASSRKPDAWWYHHVFARWAVSCLPETRLLAQLYTDPASELLYLCSPWAWSRSSPWDTAQMAPWDEQLSYPMYTWADVPTNSPGGRPRLLRLPPLFTSKAGSASESRLPVAYNDADDLFALAEDEVDDLLDCVGAAWERMRRNGVVARLAGLGWSERGRGVLRVALLEVYRRHTIGERTTSSVQGLVRTDGQAGKGGETLANMPVKAVASLSNRLGSNSPMGAMGAADHGVSRIPAHHGIQSTGAQVAIVEPTGGPGGAPASGMSAEHQHRGRQLHFFNRRGRIADSLDLLWGEMSELRAQQVAVRGELSELRARQDQTLALMQARQDQTLALLQKLLAQQQQQQQR